jgi:ABC-2 type transport system permease protein
VTTHVVDPDRVPDAPLAPPANTGGLLDVFRNRYLLRLLVRRELSARYQGSFLGLLWSYVQPAVRFAMYFFVVGMVLQLHDDVEYFGIHLFAGMVFVHYFTETFTAGTRSIVKNKALVTKMAMPREMFPVASMLVSAYHTGPQLLILTVACAVVGWAPDPAGLLAGLLGFLIIGVFATALALLFSSANVFFRDFQNVVATFTTFVHFGVPMIYPYSKVDERFGASVVEIYLANPIAEAVLLIQRAFWIPINSDPAAAAATELPDHLYLRGLIHLGAALLILALSQWVFSRLENKFPERL